MRAANSKLVIALAALATLVVAGCGSSETSLSKDEERNFKEGLAPGMAKKIGKPPTPPAGPLKGYEGGSAADKALGR